MNTKLLDFIKQLSIKDKKTLSQKALKTNEECGELAKAVLPFDGAHCTNHRFIDKSKILEEVSDVILTAISIAYSLDYSHEDIEEMLDKKSLKWLELQTKEDKIQGNVPYEIHVTVERPDDIELFRAHCKEIGVKPIILDLKNNNGSIMDSMTSSKFYGDNRGSYDEVMRISNAMKDYGYNILRKKIETIPWHPAAPIRINEMPKDCYFESHIGVKIKDEGSQYVLNFIAKEHKAHISRNFFKKLDNGEYILMLTLRNYNTTWEMFKNQVESLKTSLELGKLEYEKVEVEFSIYDTKVSHDFNWLSQ